MGLVGVSGALFSPHWYRVSALRPRLRANVRVQRQRHRNQTWYQLSDGGTGRRHRLNEAAYGFVGHLDASRTTGEVWDARMAQAPDGTLTQDDAIRVLGQLHAAGLLQCEMTPDIERLFRQHRQRVRRRRWMELNPLAVRVRLFNPSRFLEMFEPFLKLLISPLSLLLWLVMVLPALLLAAHHWPELAAFGAAHLDTPRYWLIAWFAYPLIKGIHELGHALAVRRWGGNVHDVGFTLFVLVPAPYVDASAASGFSSRWQRAVVSAIGILVELLIAALALYVWLTVQSGWVQDVAFVVMLIAAVSTVLFNGNPLLRFDGYHVLCDVADLPNLDTRSRAWWANLIQRAVFRVDEPPMPLAAGEGKWLLLYAPLALAYRIYVGVLIAFWIGAKSLLLGLVAALALLLSMVVIPVVRAVRRIQFGAHGARYQRARRILWGGATATLLVLTVLPVPYGTVAPGVVWLPEQAEVRTQTDGFIRNVQVRDGDAVAPGQVLASLEAPELQAKQAEAHSRLMALRVQYFNVMQVDRAQAQNFAQALTHAQSETEHIDARIANLEIRSQAAGRMVMARQDDLPGRFFRKGEAFGYVFAPGEVVVRTIISDDDAALVRQRSRGATVWLEEKRGGVLTGSVRRDVPAASFKLPSAGLAERNGGPVTTDPADAENLRTLQPFFTVDVALPEHAVDRMGGRAWVRFDFGTEPLAFQWAHALGQLLLKQFARAA